MKDLYICFGEIGFNNKKPLLIRTTVGACVSVCIWDQVEKQGGLCHYNLLSMEDRISANEPLNNVGVKAIRALLKKFKRQGSSINNLMATIVGGANLSFGSSDKKRHDVGERNISVARDILLEFGIPIISKSVGGNVGRRIQFDSVTGDIKIEEFDVSDCPGQDRPH